MTSSSREDLYQLVVSGLIDELSPILPLEAQRRRLLDAIEGPFRFLPFTSRVARMFDLDEDAAARALEAIVSPSAWIDGLLPNIRCAPVASGPRCRGAMNVFISAEPGSGFPSHRHLGAESVLVLQGAFREDDGSIARPGDLICKTGGSTHDFVVLEGGPCICAYSIEQGFELV